MGPMPLPSHVARMNPKPETLKPEQEWVRAWAGSWPVSWPSDPSTTGTMEGSWGHDEFHCNDPRNMQLGLGFTRFRVQGGEFRVLRQPVGDLFHGYGPNPAMHDVFVSKDPSFWGSPMVV